MTTYERYEVLVSGLGFPESLRWRDGALWYADWAAGTVYSPRLRPDPAGGGPAGELPALLRPAGHPGRAPAAARLDPRPGRDARHVAGRRARLSYASLAGFGDHPWNEIVLAADGSAYVNNIGFAYGGAVDPSQAGPVGFVVLVRPDGTVQRVADGLEFPNGMAVVDDGRTLLVAESWGSRLTAYAIGADGQLSDRRVWAETPGLHPDGIDAHGLDENGVGTVSLADVGTRCCVRVAEGGEILDRVDLPQPAFDCVVGDLGSGPTLYVAVNALAVAVIRPPARPAGYWRSRCT